MQGGLALGLLDDSQSFLSPLIPSLLVALHLFLVMSLPGVNQPPYPLHESVKHLLDPEYVDFYNHHVINNQQVHLQPIAASRTSGVLIPGAGPMLEVGKTQDFIVQRLATEGPAVPIRVFTPKGEVPAGGWPVMLYFHGGGWVLGNIDTENVVCSNLCVRGNCVVVTVDYRYALSLQRIRIPRFNI